MALLELVGVSKRYHRGAEAVVALAGVDITVDDGEFVALVGPSGSGKSTLLHLAGGLDVPDSGTVRLRGREVPSMSIAERARMRRREVGFVFQFFHLIPTLSVAENVELPLALDGRRDDAKVRALLDRLGIGHRATHRPAELSGGEMQRAAIARALVASPRLILADEPTGNLDSTTGATILDVLTETVRDSGAALLMVTHDERAASRSERVLHLRDGAVTDDALEAPATRPAGPRRSRRRPLTAGA